MGGWGRGFGGGFLPGLLGGVVGGVVGGEIDRRVIDPEPRRIVVREYESDDDAFTGAMRLISETPEGAVVALNGRELRALQERAMVSYVGEQPFVMKRRIEVV